MKTLLQARGAALLLGLSFLVGATTGCSATAHISEEAPHYPATRPLLKDTDITHEYVAQIRAIQHIELRALERGYVEGIFVDEGKAVTAGQRMFQIMPRLYQAELQHAEAAAALAEIGYRTTQGLQQRNVVSPSELGMAKAERDRAAAEVSVSQAHLGFTQIKAPFDGMMGRLEVRKGSLVEEGELLTTLSDNSQMWVYFNVTEAEYIRYRRQMDSQPLEVKLRLADGDVFEHDGRVETIEADFNNETGNIAFRATFPNPDSLLRHGETGKVLVTTTMKNAMIIPQKATFTVLDKKYVFVVDAEHVAHQREIHVTQDLPYVVIVSSGLEAGEQILLEGQRKVRDGQEIGIELKEPEEVIEHLRAYAE